MSEGIPVRMTSPQMIAPHLRRAGSSAVKQYVPLMGWLLAPAAATGYAMAFWRFAADMKWVDQFFISEGLLSRWQVWLALSAALQAGAHYLNRNPGTPEHHPDEP